MRKGGEAIEILVALCESDSASRDEDRNLLKLRSLDSFISLFPKRQ